MPYAIGGVMWKMGRHAFSQLHRGRKCPTQFTRHDWVNVSVYNVEAASDVGGVFDESRMVVLKGACHHKFRASKFTQAFWGTRFHGMGVIDVEMGQLDDAVFDYGFTTSDLTPLTPPNHNTKCKMLDVNLRSTALGDLMAPRVVNGWGRTSIIRDVYKTVILDTPRVLPALGEFLQSRVIDNGANNGANNVNVVGFNDDVVILKQNGEEPPCEHWGCNFQHFLLLPLSPDPRVRVMPCETWQECIDMFFRLGAEVGGIGTKKK
jgi:hypothetical protein